MGLCIGTCFTATLEGACPCANYDLMRKKMNYTAGGLGVWPEKGQRGIYFLVGIVSSITSMCGCRYAKCLASARATIHLMFDFRARAAFAFNAERSRDEMIIVWTAKRQKCVCLLAPNRLLSALFMYRRDAGIYCYFITQRRGIKVASENPLFWNCCPEEAAFDSASIKDWSTSSMASIQFSRISHRIFASIY